MKKAKLADSICNSVISLRFFIRSLAFSTNFFSCASKYVKILVYVARNAGGRSENQEGLQRNRRYLDKKNASCTTRICKGAVAVPPWLPVSAGPGSSASKKRFQFHEVVNQKCLVTNILVKAKVA